MNIVVNHGSIFVNVSKNRPFDLFFQVFISLRKKAASESETRCIRTFYLIKHEVGLLNPPFLHSNSCGRKLNRQHILMQVPCRMHPAVSHSQSPLGLQLNPHTVGLLSQIFIFLNAQIVKAHLSLCWTQLFLAY